MTVHTETLIIEVLAIIFTLGYFAVVLYHHWHTRPRQHNHLHALRRIHERHHHG